MTRLSTSFVRDRELIIVEAEVVGRAGRTTGARLVLDTGAAATTLTPRVIQAVGYSRRDAYKESTVHTAIGKERGYWIRVAEFTVLDVTTPDFALTVFPLGHRNIDGLVGMNFLRPVGCARVLDHDRSVLALLDRTGLVPGATVIHTAGRPLCVTPGFSSRKPPPKRVAKPCHGAADPAGSSQTTTDEETR